MKITATEYRDLTQHIRKLSGIYLDDSKKYLVETRLKDLLKEFGCRNYGELYQKALSDPAKRIDRRIVDAISTNETLFFRDDSPFKLLKNKILPEVIDARTSQARGARIPIRIWSAACSTGQEVYSIAITVKELLNDLRKYNIKILGTDISDAAIAKASRGRYDKFDVSRGLDGVYLNKYFRKMGDSVVIRDEIRAMVTFKKFNLMSAVNGLGKFDIIFCRNVAIYFTPEDRKKLFTRLAGALEPDGFLIIGGTESLTGVCPLFKPERHLGTLFYTLK